MASFLSIGFFVFIPAFYQKTAVSHARRRRFVFFVQSGCSGGNLPPTGPQGRNRGTFVSATAKPETPVIPTVAQAEWRNPLRGIMNHHKIKLATWEDSSTPFHSARNDMSEGGSVHPHRLYSGRCQPLAGAGWRQIAAATVGIPYLGSYHSPPQVIHPTWRAADCRPSKTFV